MEKGDQLSRLQQENRKLKERLDKIEGFTKLHEEDFLLYDSSPVGVILIGDNYIIEYANNKCEQIFSTDKSNIIGSDFRIWITKSYSKLVTERYSKRRAGNVIPDTYEFQIIDYHKQVKDIEITSAIINSTTGVRTISQLVDITEKKAAEEAYKQSQEFLGNVFDAIQDGISILDSNMRIKMTNRFMEKMYADQMPLVGKKCYEVYHQSDKPCSVCPTLMTLQTGATAIETVPYVKKGKKQGWLELSTFPLKDENQKVYNIIEYVKDITDHENANRQLQETSDKLANMIRAANDGTWDWHLATGVVEFGPRYYEMAGYEVNEFPHILDEFKDRVHPDDLDNVMKEAQEHLNGKNDRFIVEFQFRKKNGRYMWILGRGIVVERNEAGKPIRLMGTHTEITELKKITQDLRKAKEKAEESDRLKSAFLANMSHEIRTPMNGILGFTDLLQDIELSKDERQEYLNVIRQSGNRMLDTLNDIIDISRIEAGQVEVILSKVDINTHIDYLYKFFLPETKEKNLDFTFYKERSEEEVIVETDHEKLLAILTNLIKNSIKYTYEGCINFGYKTRRNAFEFYVKDTGIGISKERQHAIFDRFVQADLTVTKRYEGAGLGLTISKGYVDLLKGDIWVESEPDKGASFYFTIPVKGVLKSFTDKSDLSKRDEQTDSMNNLKILIAEDDESAMFYLSELLKRQCKTILKARSGLEAVEIFRKDPTIDLILMDIKMPDMNGFEATRQIKKIRPDVKIIGQTAYALIGDRDKVLAAGCDDYVTKPINKNVLQRIISKHLQ